MGGWLSLPDRKRSFHGDISPLKKRQVRLVHQRPAVEPQRWGLPDPPRNSSERLNRTALAGWML